MIPLSHPMLRPEIDAQQIIKYSQRMVDVLNLESGQLESLSVRGLMKALSFEDVFYAFSFNREGHLSPPLFKGQGMNGGAGCITFDNLLEKTPFVPLMKRILRRLELAYGRPVDVEFAWDHEKLYILQCRSLAVSEELERVELPMGVPAEAILFTNERIVSNSIVKDMEYIVYVDPKAYGQLPRFEDKVAIGRVVSRLNRLLEGRRYGLFGPGRWGSNDINLGVRVGYEDINRTLILVEIAFEEDGATPEVSSGTHFFNDLVEARIVPIALFPDQPDTIFREDFFRNSHNQLLSFSSDFSPYESVVRVVHVPASANGRFLQIYQDSEGQRGIGFLDFSANERT
jgi:hypothetical protein